MQKHFRTGIDVPFEAVGKKIYTEALNPNFGYFYTINEILKQDRSKFQDIVLADTDEFGKVLLLDNITQVAEKKEFEYHELMVHPALCSHLHPESVLIIGGGDGGIAREVLKYSVVKRIELAELDEGVIKFSQKYLKTVHGGAFDDPRLNVNIVDGRKFAEDHPGEFDIVIMDMTDPFGPSKMLYTKDFFESVKRSMKDDNGIFVMHSESPIARPEAFACINKTLSSTFEHVCPFYLYIQMYAVLWSVTLSSNKTDIANIRPEFIENQLKKYDFDDLKVYSPQTHVSMQVAFPFIKEILKRGARIITDKNPDFPDNFLS
ncbi:MAG: polyamine aminopropyltransferase [Fibrobacter sp.]|nr:polyamine aminopropyltransferase [Fibrobacter sp.]